MINRGDATAADPRAAREAELKQQKADMLKGKAGPKRTEADELSA